MGYPMDQVHAQPECHVTQKRTERWTVSYAQVPEVS